MRTLVLTLALALTVTSTAAAHAEPLSFDLVTPKNRDRAHAKKVAGAVALSLGIASFVAGIAAETSAAGDALGYLICNPRECAEIESALRPRAIGGGVAIGLGAAAVVGGAITLALGKRDEQAGGREIRFTLAPGPDGATGMLRLRF